MFAHNDPSTQGQGKCFPLKNRPSVFSTWTLKKFGESQVSFSTNFSLCVSRLVQKTTGSTKLFPEALASYSG